MKSLLLCISLLVIMGTLHTTHGQGAYESAVGIRFGNPNAVSYKKFIKGDLAGEAYISFRSTESSTTIGLAVAGLKHMPIPDVENLSWYYGAGAAVSLISHDDDTADSDPLGLSIQGYIGLDYAIPDFPLNFSIDWIPTIPLLGGGNFIADSGNLSIRYILSK